MPHNLISLQHRGAVEPYMETVAQIPSVEPGIAYTIERTLEDGHLVFRQTIGSEVFADMVLHPHDLPALRAALIQIEQPMVMRGNKL